MGSIIYTKPGETVRGSFSIGEEYINAEGDESLQSVAVELIDPSGKVVQTLNFNGTEAIGSTKSFTDQPVSTASVWSVRYTSGRGADPGYFGLEWNFGTYSGAVEQKGRVWTSTHRVGQRRQDPTTGKTALASLQLYYLNRLGFVYRADYNKFMGVDSEFSTSELGVRESAKSCTSAYSSYGSLTIDAAQGANVLGFKQYSECDDANKTFLSNPDPTLPAIVTLPDGTTDWLYAPTIKPTVLSILSYTHKVGDPSMAGTIAGSVENYRGNVTMRIDVDGDGKFNGANDRNVTIGTKGGVVSYAWDGKDAKGNAVPVGTNISFRLDADRKGEIHFARWDIE